MERKGKLGLALSGGGFRASLFHIGVLAALADRDVLRSVEVISTVSGGSIVGALYCLKVKRLLEAKADEEITAGDYQQLVADMAESFLVAVQKNIRLRTFANPIKNARMAWPNYSRSDRIGELLDTMLYRPALDPDRNEPVMMKELLIHPKGCPSKTFHPDRGNRGRRAKVPVLIINATSLNTGRNWRFEGIRMGEPEPQGAFAADVDMRMRLVRPPTYDAIGSRHRRMRLGHAVAASAAVPAIFHPLALSRLYPNVRVELIDGGVHDNQGVRALLDRGCDAMIISDGSAQMQGEEHPGTSIPSVLLRSNQILMSRVREEQLLRAYQSHPSSVHLMHLQRGLAVEEIPYRAVGTAAKGANGSKVTKDTKDTKDTKNGKSGFTISKSPGKPAAPDNHLGPIHPEVQRALARIRTDLDAFHDAESFALMYSGYIITAQELHTSVLTHGRIAPKPFEWRFMEVAPLMRHPTSDFMRVLNTASANAFKVFALYPGLTTVTLIIGAAVVVVALLKTPDALREPIIPPDKIPSRLSLLLAAGAGLAAMMPAVRRHLVHVRQVQSVWRWVRAPVRFVERLLFRALPWVAATGLVWFSLFVLNPLYLRAGKVGQNGRGTQRKRQTPLFRRMYRVVSFFAPVGTRSE